MEIYRSLEGLGFGGAGPVEGEFSSGDDKKKTFQKGKGVVTCGVFLKNNNHGNFGTTVFFKKT